METQADADGTSDLCHRKCYDHVVLSVQVYAKSYTREIRPIAYQIDPCSSDEETPAPG